MMMELPYGKEPIEIKFKNLPKIDFGRFFIAISLNYCIFASDNLKLNFGIFRII